MNEGENVTVKLRAIEDFREAISALAAELVRQNEVQVGTGKLVQKWMRESEWSRRSSTIDHGVLERHGMVPPRPKGGIRVN